MKRQPLLIRFSLTALLSALLLASPLSLVKAEDKVAVIDWAKGAVQETRNDCGPFNFIKMKDKQAYTLYVRGTKSASCSFSAAGLRFHYPPNYGPTSEGNTTIFYFARFGSDVLIEWTPGYYE